MRPIHLCQVDKTRPVVVLSRSIFREDRRWVTVAPITSNIKGLSTEVRVGAHNGIDHDAVITCDMVTTVASSCLGRHLGFLLADQEASLAAAIAAAFDLDFR